MIVIDIGNSDVVLGFYNENKLANTLRIRSIKEESITFFAYKILDFMLENGISKQLHKKIVISSVVPVLTPVFVELSNKFLFIDPIVINPAHSKQLRINIDFPEELGSDLFANAIAAHSEFNSNCIVVDFGTALTFTSVSAQGEILGVAIFPGLRTAVKSLFSQTSLLPEVRIEKPASVLGKNTLTAIQAGIVFGYEGLVKEIVQKTKEEIGEDCAVIATGGLAGVLTGLDSLFIKVDKELTLRGLYIFGESYLK